MEHTRTGASGKVMLACSSAMDRSPLTRAVKSRPPCTHGMCTKYQHRWLDTGTHARKVRKCVRPDWQAEGFVDGEELKTKCPVEGLLHPNRMHRNTDSSQTRVAVSTQASLLWKTPQTIQDIPDACHRWQRG